MILFCCFLGKDLLIVGNWNRRKILSFVRNISKRNIKISEKQRIHLDWKLDPVPTILVEVLQHPASLPTHINIRKPPAKRVYQEDQMPKFLMEVDPVIRNIFDLEQHWLEEFACVKSNDCLLLYRFRVWRGNTNSKNIRKHQIKFIFTCSTAV